jgi:hypothetical protein
MELHDQLKKLSMLTTCILQELQASTVYEQLTLVFRIREAPTLILAIETDYTAWGFLTFPRPTTASTYFPTDLSSYYYTLYNLSYWQCR